MTVVRVHVVPVGKSWALIRDGGERFGDFPTEAEAEAAAKTYVRGYGDGQVVIHLSDGMLEHRSRPRAPREGRPTEA